MPTLRDIFHLEDYSSRRDNPVLEEYFRTGAITPTSNPLAEGGSQQGYNVDWSKMPTIQGTRFRPGQDTGSDIWVPVSADGVHDEKLVVNDPNYGPMTPSSNNKGDNSTMTWLGPLLVGGFAGAGAMGLLPGAAGAGTGFAGTTAAGWTAAEEAAALGIGSEFGSGGTALTLGTAGTATAPTYTAAELQALGYTGSEIAALPVNEAGMYTLEGISTGAAGTGANILPPGEDLGIPPLEPGQTTTLDPDILPGAPTGGSGGTDPLTAAQDSTPKPTPTTPTPSTGGGLLDIAKKVATALGLPAGAIQAIAGLLTGVTDLSPEGIWKALTGGDNGRTISALLSAYGNYKAAEDWDKVINDEEWRKRLDPFGQDRGQYRQLLSDYYKDPLSVIQKLPGYGFTMNAALNSLDNKAGATRRFMGSAYPQWLQDRAGDVASKYAQQYESNLARYAGADIGPQTYGGVVSNAMEQQQKHQSNFYNALATAFGAGQGTNTTSPGTGGTTPPTININTGGNGGGTATGPGTIWDNISQGGGAAKDIYEGLLPGDPLGDG